MKVLILGSGGREHALAWKIAQSSRVREVWCAPGNGGIGRDARLASFSADTPAGIDAALRFARQTGIDLTVVGPEAPLVAGVVDRFEDAGLRIFGPRAGAARLEGSKCFTKEFLARHGIPTAPFRIFDGAASALAHIESAPLPVVIKADGLAAGKGVFVCKERREARDAIHAVMVERQFGAAGDRLLVEDFLPGRELTLIAITDGSAILPLETAQDYKAALDGHRGPNTGGMGSYSPHVSLDDPLIGRIIETILQPTLRGLREEGLPYRGAIYAGLMLTAAGPQLLEYNVRFGDPETQPILMRLRTELVDVFEACLDGSLARARLEWDPGAAVCVVAASRGYPGKHETGKRIEGLEAAESSTGDIRGRVKVFVAGARSAADGGAGSLETAGGRVLGVTALAADRPAARRLAYEALAKISFEGMTHRSDIGA